MKLNAGPTLLDHVARSWSRSRLGPISNLDSGQKLVLKIDLETSPL